MTSPQVQRFRSKFGVHVLVVDGSRIYDVDEATFESCENGDIPDDLRATSTPAYIDETPFKPANLRAISLNVAQGCNMSCSYCYADEGRFGAHARLMDRDVATNAIDTFLAQVPLGADAVVGYMGGEPFLNACLIHEITRYASEKATSRGIRLRFSVTTNATLLRDTDLELLRAYPFSVSVSLDGGQVTNDLQRRMSNGQSAFDRIIAGIAKLTDPLHRPRHISLRATVTPRSESLPAMLMDMLSLGVDEAGFAPVLVSPNRYDEFTRVDFERFLAEMIECGQMATSSLLEREKFPFSNFETALQEIHKGTHRPYPCGAAAGYASVGAEGRLFGCHRAIGDPQFAIGSVHKGTDDVRRSEFLTDHHVLRQAPCKNCWARFLCGGGCYHEVLARGRIGCDYIRGWLEFCLAAYAELSLLAPGYFSAPDKYFLNSAVEVAQ